MKKTIGFGNGITEEENPYLGRWVIIYPQGISSSFCGKVREITGNYAILNPFYTLNSYVKRNKETLRKSALTKGDFRVPLINAAIEPTTKSSLENAVKFHNEQKKKNDSLNKSD